jgi:hypothetical protein
MTDGNESYRIRWEGTLKSGNAVILTASDKEMMNEDIQKMKQLMGYKPQDTLGLVKGKARISENNEFNTFYNKTKKLLGETEDIDGQDAESEGQFDDADINQAAEAKKHVQGSTSTDKGTVAPKPKLGTWDKISVPHAAEAKKHIQGGVSDSKGTMAPKPKLGNFDTKKPQSPEAKKHMQGKVNENEVAQQPEELKSAKMIGDKIKSVLSPDELNFLTQAYQKGGKEMVANAIDTSFGGSTNEDTNTEPPAEGEFGMSKNEIKLRQIIDKIQSNSTVASILGVVPAAMAFGPGAAIGLGIAGLVGFLTKDAAWWKTNSHHHQAQNKYGVK